MSESFTKLFGSILASTVWQEPDATRLTWITMLAMADKEGFVRASVPGLAHLARVSLKDCEFAIATFLNPDPYSRTPDHEGRRIEVSPDGGWKLLNHASYRAVRDQDSRKDYQREWDRNNRKRNPTESDNSDTIRHETTHTDTDAEADTEKSLFAPSDDGRVSRFEEFWKAYPVKKGRAKAEATWKRKKLDRLADKILADISMRAQKDGQWLDGYIPHGSTYVSQEGWNDVILPRKVQPAYGYQAPRPNAQPMHLPELTSDD